MYDIFHETSEHRRHAGSCAKQNQSNDFACFSKPHSIKPLPEQITKRKTLKTLIVEDEPTHTELTEIQLNGKFAKSKGFNFDITSASNSTEAIKAAKKASLNGGLDIILMDIKIPGGKNGIEVAKEIQKMLPNTPILFVSGLDIGQMKDDFTRSDDVHALTLLEKVIKKPVKNELLLSAIERLCPSE